MSWIETPSTAFFRAFATDNTDSAYDAIVSTITPPNGAGVWDTGRKNSLIVVPYGTDAADEAYGLKVIGWCKVSSSGVDEWVPTEIFVGTVTLGAATGAADGVIGDTALWADAITYVSGDSAYEVPTVTANSIAWLNVDVRGVEKVQFLIENTTSASANCLFRFI